MVLGNTHCNNNTELSIATVLDCSIILTGIHILTAKIQAFHIQSLEVSLVGASI